MLFSVVFVVVSAALGLASPLIPRADPDNTVTVVSANNFCMIMPRQPNTDIGVSESEGQMQSYCTAGAKTDVSQGVLPANFWTAVAFEEGTGKGAYVQLTGCIRDGFSQLNYDDGGGQYDSSGGDGGQGNPQGSVCTGYNHYVEIVEPREHRACIRCCQDPDDCPLDKDTAGCPAVIPGTYC